MAKQILVQKEGGDMEPFDVSKLIHSLHRSGASESVTDVIVKEIRKELVHGLSTKYIYQRAFALLKKQSAASAARYSLKRAVLELGPSGFPFEDFIGEIFRAKGYRVLTGVHVMGACVEHEVDLVAESDANLLVGEIKFHNQLGMKSDVKVALYVHARIEDIQKARAERGERKIDQGWLITNTKFTKAAVQYANCKGLKILSWTYPRYGNIQDLVEETKIHPITCLTTLSRQEKVKLMERGILLCKSIEENREALSSIGMSGAKLQRVLEEGKLLCNIRL